jgi:hypothetical protein
MSTTRSISPWIKRYSIVPTLAISTIVDVQMERHRKEVTRRRLHKRGRSLTLQKMFLWSWRKMGESASIPQTYRAMLTVSLQDGAEEGDLGTFTPEVFN